MGFVENVNKLATDLTPVVISGIADVVAHGDELETLHNNIADVNAVVDTIIPNMTEILAADTNAAIATAQAGIATTKANEAITAANTAVLSEAVVTQMLDTFDDRYLGPKSTDPVVDNDGNVLLVGALYFNTVSNQMRVWDGVAWTDSLTLTAGSVSVLTNKTIDAMTNTVGADHVHYKCRNVSGSTIAKGVVVAAQGTQSGTDYIEIVPVTDPQTQIALGVTHVSIVNNGTGLVLNTGVEEDRNTSAWAVGTILYPNTTGGFTSTKPTTGKYQACAVVLRQHTNQGTLLCEFTEPKYIASTTQAGYVQLNNTLTSTSTTEALTAAQGKVLQDGKQPLDATLTALAGVTTTADKYIYATAADTFTTGTITSFGRSLVDDADAATARGTLGLGSIATQNANAVSITGGSVSGITDLAVADGGTGASDAATARTNLGVAIGTNVQAYDAGLQSIAGLTTSADKMIYTTASDTYAVATLTAAGRALLDDTDAAAQRTTLGISATNTPSTAVGGISATNVQEALQELDSEKMSTAEYLTAVGTINNPLLYMPLMSDIDLHKGVGTSTFTRASTATYIDRYGVLKTAGIDEPRFEKEGYLNEGSSTNLFLRSQEFGDASWAAVRLSINANTSETVDPFGTNLAGKVKVDSSLSSSHYVTQSGLSIGGTSGVSVTKSIFAKAGNGTGAGRYISLSTSSYPAWANDGAVFFDLVAGVVSGGSGLLYSSGNYKMEALANGWYRCSIYQIADTGGTTITTTNINMCNGISDTFDGNDTDYIYVFGAQLEALPFATSYIPTTSATVTRAADKLDVTRANNIPNTQSNSIGYSVVFDYDTYGANTSNQYLWGVASASNNGVGGYLSTGLSLRNYANNSTGNTLNSSAPSNLLSNRVVQTQSNTLLSEYTNGVLLDSDINTLGKLGETTNALGYITIGGYTPSTTSNLYGHISNFRIYNKALTAQEVALA